MRFFARLIFLPYICAFTKSLEMKKNKSKKRYITSIIEKANNKTKYFVGDGWLTDVPNYENNAEFISDAENEKYINNNLTYSALSKIMKTLRKKYEKIIIENRQQTVYGVDMFNEMKEIEAELKKLNKELKPSFPKDRIVR